MIKIIMLVIYMMGDDLVIEQKPFDTPEACEVAGVKRVKELSQNPRFEEGILAACIRARASVV